MAYKKSKEKGFREFNEVLKKGNVSNMMFLYGEEDFLIKWAIEGIISKYIKAEFRQIDTVKLDGDTANIEDIVSNIGAFSMFSEKRVVIIRNYLPLYKKSEGDTKKILKALSESYDNSILIFYLDSDKSKTKTKLTEGLAEISDAYCFNKLDERELKGFIKKRLDGRKLKYDSKIIDYCIYVSGYLNKDSEYRLIDLENDLNKMGELTDDGVITEKEVNLSILGADDTYIFNLLDSICKKDKKTAMNIAVKKMKNEDNIFQLLSLITGQFEIMYDIKEMEKESMVPAQINGKLKLNKYRFDKAYKFSKNFKAEEIKKDLIALYDIDKKIKSGDLQQNMVIELFISSI